MQEDTNYPGESERMMPYRPGRRSAAVRGR